MRGEKGTGPTIFLGAERHFPNGSFSNREGSSGRDLHKAPNTAVRTAISGTGAPTYFNCKQEDYWSKECLKKKQQLPGL